MEAFLPAWRLADMVRDRRIGCRELLDFYIDRVTRLDTALNAVVVRDFERARARAAALDNARAREGALFGVPMTVKESFDLRGHPTSWGFPALRDNRAEEDALAIRRLEDAGAVVFGKTNVPAGLGDWQSYNAIYGSTNNPWDLGTTPGGSSGGGAAACAAGLGGLELGSDIAGSIRVPAHFCGLFGHKPSWGLVSPRGHSPTRSAAMLDISVIGPLARSARDLHTALSVIAGPDPDETALRLVLPPTTVKSIRGLRVAIWAEQPGAATGAETVTLLGELGRFLAKDGAAVSFDARPAIDPQDSHRVFLSLLDAALSIRLPPAVLEQRRAALATLAPDDMSAGAIMLRATGMTHTAWLALNERRSQMRRAWSTFFRDWDVLLCPAAPVPAFPHQQDEPLPSRHLIVDGESRPYSDMLFWAGPAGVSHLPATVAPLGLSASGLPIGVQILGPLHGDLTTITVGAMLEEAWRGFHPPPFG